VAEFKHIFEHFTTPMQEPAEKKEEEQAKVSDGEEDASGKT